MSPSFQILHPQPKTAHLCPGRGTVPFSFSQGCPSSFSGAAGKEAVRQVFLHPQPFFGKGWPAGVRRDGRPSCPFRSGPAHPGTIPVILAGGMGKRGSGPRTVRRRDGRSFLFLSGNRKDSLKKTGRL
ncbi:MAG: hypothetical protein C6P37_13830 [Caldibacillus debilis]|uniref:Uncharacterized protein n=1 Tax=Caldibacillus debilis TaxID=301148 RepID=A0A3E0K0D2_9BACI|nr:MAG: hypothetical protein BAA03_07635 [Caldibacillus debilis]REJ26259.1 MAG: hypothetical protein C6P37_13830 [Caldibacillus debilis]REJ28247.1 MAG: hypothetical protein C6W56_08305 [Caldibacillus debilis]